jgi:LSD1 subclass zinc finger protein
LSAFNERRDQDIQKLRDLQRQSRDRIRVTRVSGHPIDTIDLELQIKTAPSKLYPKNVQNVTHLSISLPARYPFIEPTVTIKTPIHHPNVYSSGRICLGMKWIPSFGLDLLVRRIVQIVTFDPTILNEKSPANGEALKWYRETLLADPSAFPTDSLRLSAAEPTTTMKWADVSVGPAKTVVSCPSCRSNLSLPAGKQGQVKCPKCGNFFQAAT